MDLLVVPFVVSVLNITTFYECVREVFKIINLKPKLLTRLRNRPKNRVGFL